MEQLDLQFGSIGLDAFEFSGQHSDRQKWLVEDIWASGATGLLVGDPKLGKTWIIIALALAVASGKPFLGKFAVPTPGRVVLHSPEGDQDELVDRIHQTARRMGIDPFHENLKRIECSERIFIDSPNDQSNLERMVAEWRPCLVIMDPLSKLMLGSPDRYDDCRRMADFVERLGRQYGCATPIVHHKNQQGGMRGDGLLYSFGESYLWLEKTNGVLSLRTTQKHASGLEPFGVYLSTQDGDTMMSVMDGAYATQKELDDLILEELGKLAPWAAMTQRDLRKTLGGSNGKYPAALKELIDANLVVKTPDGYRLTRAEDRSGPPRGVPPHPDRTARTGGEGPAEPLYIYGNLFRDDLAFEAKKSLYLKGFDPTDVEGMADWGQI